VEDTIAKLESMVEKLNNIQLDDCKAAKALVTAPIATFGIGTETMKAEAATAITDFKVSSGYDQDWTKSVNDLKSSFANMFTSGNSSATSGTAAATNSALSGCPLPLRNLFKDGSLLENIASEKGFTDDQTRIIRGFVGDVYLFGPGTTGSTIESRTEPPCGKNDYESLLNGTYQVRSANGNCTNVPASNNLQSFARERMTSVVSSLKNHTNQSETDKAFMQTISPALPVWPALRAGVRVNNEEAVVQQLADVTANIYAYNIFLDINSQLLQIKTWIEHVKSTQKSPSAGNDIKSCNLALLTAPMSNIQTLIDSSQTFTQQAYAGAIKAAQNMVAISTLVGNLQRFDEMTRQHLSANFSRGIATRLLGN